MATSAMVTNSVAGQTVDSLFRVLPPGYPLRAHEPSCWGLSTTTMAGHRSRSASVQDPTLELLSPKPSTASLRLTHFYPDKKHCSLD